MTAPTTDPTPYWALTADELTPEALIPYLESELLDPLAKIIRFYRHVGAHGPDPISVAAAFRLFGNVPLDREQRADWAADAALKLDALEWAATILGRVTYDYEYADGEYDEADKDAADA